MNPALLRSALLSILLLAVSACANPIDDVGVVAAELTAYRIIGSPTVVDDDGGAMPHLITNDPTMAVQWQSIAYEGSDDSIRLAARDGWNFGADGVLQFGSWDVDQAFGPGAHVVPYFYPGTQRYYAPYHAFWRDGADLYRWVSMARVATNELVSPSTTTRHLWLARSRVPVNQSSPVANAGTCGEDANWDCYNISGAASCAPLGPEVDDDGPEIFRAPFVFSPSSLREDPTSPQEVLLVWTTHGVAVAASFDPTDPTNVTCWKIGDPGSISGSSTGHEEGADWIDAIVAAPTITPARAHVFTSERPHIGALGLRHNEGGGTAWQPASTWDDITAQPSLDTPPLFPRGVPTTYSPVWNVVVSSAYPYPGTTDPCLADSPGTPRPRRFFYTADGGSSFTQSDMPALWNNPQVCHATVSMGELDYTQQPYSLVFFYSGSDVRVTAGFADGSAWEQHVYQVDGVGGLNPSAVVEPSRRAMRDGTLSFQQYYFIHTVAHYDRDNGHLRVVRGTF